MDLELDFRSISDFNVTIIKKKHNINKYNATRLT